MVIGIRFAERSLYLYILRLNHATFVQNSCEIHDSLFRFFISEDSTVCMLQFPFQSLQLPGVAHVLENQAQDCEAQDNGVYHERAPETVEAQDGGRAGSI